MKVNGKQIIGDKFAYDGCHKIYILEDKIDIADAKYYEYEIKDIETLEETFKNSCPLRFISNWKLTKHYVVQFEDAKFE